MPRKRRADTNHNPTGLLRLAAVQASKQSKWDTCGPRIIAAPRAD